MLTTRTKNALLMFDPLLAAPGGEAGGHRAVRNSDQGEETKPDVAAEL